MLIRFLITTALMTSVSVAYAQVEKFNDRISASNAPYSAAARAGNLLFISGQIGRGFDGALVEGGIEPESHQVMRNIRDIVYRQGLRMDDVVKCSVFLADIAEWPTFNTIYAQYFNAPYPARSALGVNGLAGGARLEVECIAAYPDRPPMPMDRASTQPGS